MADDPRPARDRGAASDDGAESADTEDATTSVEPSAAATSGPVDRRGDRATAYADDERSDDDEPVAAARPRPTGTPAQETDDAPSATEPAPSDATPSPAPRGSGEQLAEVAEVTANERPADALGTPQTTKTLGSTVMLRPLPAALAAPATPTAPTRPMTLWALLTLTGQQIRRTFANSTPTITYDPLDNRLVEGTDHVAGALEVSDPDGEDLEFTVAKPAHGRVTVNPDGAFVYDPDDGYVGPDAFEVAVSDAAEFHVHGLFGFLLPKGGHTATKIVNVIVTGVNRAPVVGTPGFVVIGMDSTTGAVTGTVKVTDPDNDRLSYALAGGPDPALGSATIDPGTALWTFTPTAEARAKAYSSGASLTATFSVTATDVRNNTVWVTVAALVDPKAPATTATAPTAPAAPTVKPSATSVLVTWAPPHNGGSPITRYSVRYRVTGGAWTLATDAPASATSATITGLVENADYEIAVRATNMLGNSAWSAAKLTHTTGEIIVPEPDPGTPPAADVLWQDKFDTAPNGQLTKATGDALFGPTAALTNGDTYKHGTILTDRDGGKLLRQSIPAGELGAFIVSPKLAHATEHAILSYDIRFDENFDWRWGGKMPGLVGVAPGHGIYEPTSGNADRSVGFSTRLMWHGRGDDGSRPFQGTLGPIPAGTDNDIVTYIYASHPSTGFNGYGWHTSLGGELQRGQWHHITMEVKLNTVGARDGVFKVWIDDTLSYSATDWQYRDRADVKIEAVLYDIHRGGGTTPPSWVSSRDTYVDVRNMVVTEQ